MKKKSNFKIFKVMNFSSKTRFGHLLLSITFNDKFYICHLDILYSEYLPQQ